MSERMYRPGDFEPTPSVVMLTRQELEARRLRLYQRFPELEGWTPECECGSPWCGNPDLSADARDAASDLQSINFLLGEDR